MNKKNAINNPKAFNSKRLDQQASNKGIKYFFIIAILVLTAFVFSESLKNDFVNWDDDVYITGNSYIKDLSFNGIKTIFHSYFNDELPMTHLSFAIDYHFWKLNPKPYHAVNLIFHLLNILLVYFFILFISKKSDIALLTSILFAVHPFRVESVAWTAERKDVLFTFFYLLSLICYCYYILKGYKTRYIVISFFLAILSLLSKFTAVSLPFILILLDYYFSRTITYKTILEKLPFLIFPIISLITHFFLSNQQFLDNSLLISKFSFFQRIFFAGYALFFYLISFVIPYKLSAIHPFPVKTIYLPFEYYFFSFIILILLFFIFRFIYLYIKNRKMLIFGFLFFLSTIFLVLHLVPFGGWVIVAERYTYLPYIGLSFLAANLFINISNDKRFVKMKIYLYFLFGLIIIFFSITSYERCKIWNNSIALYTDVLDKYPHVALALDNRAEAKGRIQDYQGALKDCNMAIKFQPDFSNAYCNRGNAKGMLKDYHGAIEDFSFALKLSPKDGVVYFNRGITKNYLQDYKGALADYDMAIKLKKNYLEAYFNRGITRNAIKDFKGSIEDYNKALSINPNFIDANRNRANTRFNLLDYQGAINDMDVVINKFPNDASLYYNRAISKIYLKRINEACIDLSISSQLGNKQANDLIQQYCK